MCLRDEWSDRFPSFASPPSFPTFAVSCEDASYSAWDALWGLQELVWPGLWLSHLTSPETIYHALLSGTRC